MKWLLWQSEEEDDPFGRQQKLAAFLDGFSVPASKYPARRRSAVIEINELCEEYARYCAEHPTSCLGEAEEMNQGEEGGQEEEGAEIVKKKPGAGVLYSEEEDAKEEKEQEEEEGEEGGEMAEDRVDEEPSLSSGGSSPLVLSEDGVDF